MAVKIRADSNLVQKDSCSRLLDGAKAANKFLLDATRGAGFASEKIHIARVFDAFSCFSSNKKH